MTLYKYQMKALVHMRSAYPEVFADRSYLNEGLCAVVVAQACLSRVWKMTLLR